MLAHIEPTLNLFHFGLVVLIWLVQLVIYPSLRYADPQTFQVWHRRYTDRVSFVVVPLMIGQLGLATLRVGLQWNAPETMQLPAILVLTIIVGCWAATFLVSVPIHTELQERGWVPALIDQLIVTNWIRTGLWNAVFLIDFLY